jgi:hypothetical protein
VAAMTSFRLSDEIRELLKALAERNDMSQAALVGMLIRTRARQEGLLPALVHTEEELRLPESMMREGDDLINGSERPTPASIPVVHRGKVVSEVQSEEEPTALSDILDPVGKRPPRVKLTEAQRETIFGTRRAKTYEEQMDEAQQRGRLRR